MCVWFQISALDIIKVVQPVVNDLESAYKQIENIFSKLNINIIGNYKE